MTEVFLGIDVGSTTVKAVAVDRSARLLSHRYIRAHGRRFVHQRVYVRG